MTWVAHTSLYLILHDARVWAEFLETVGQQAWQRGQRLSLLRFTR